MKSKDITKRIERIHNVLSALPEFSTVLEQKMFVLKGDDFVEMSKTAIKLASSFRDEGLDALTMPANDIIKAAAEEHGIDISTVVAAPPDAPLASTETEAPKPAKPAKPRPSSSVDGNIKRINSILDKWPHASLLPSGTMTVKSSMNGVVSSIEVRSVARDIVGLMMTRGLAPMKQKRETVYKFAEAYLNGNGKSAAPAGVLQNTIPDAQEDEPEEVVSIEAPTEAATERPAEQVTELQVAEPVVMEPVVTEPVAVVTEPVAVVTEPVYATFSGTVGLAQTDTVADTADTEEISVSSAVPAQAKIAKDDDETEQERHYGDRPIPIELSIYTLLSSATQLARLDRTVGTKDRRHALDSVTKMYSELLPEPV